MVQAAAAKPSLHEMAVAVGLGAATAEEAHSPAPPSAAPQNSKEEAARPIGRVPKAFGKAESYDPDAIEVTADHELSGDDTCSTNVSDDECPRRRSGTYGFDFDALPPADDLDGSERLWQLEDSPPWQHERPADFSRSSSEGSSEESVTWHSCYESGSFSRSVTEQMAEVAEANFSKLSSQSAMFDFDDLPAMMEAPEPAEQAEQDPSSTCSGCGFDFDDLPTLPATFFSPEKESLSGRGFETERLQTCAEGFGFDFDDLPPLPATTATPTTSTRSSSPDAVSPKSGELRPLQPLPTQRRTFISNPKVASAGSRVAVVLNGSVGDVQPLVALAKQLELFRHRVRVFTTSNLTSFVRDRGVDAVPVFADTQAVINEMGGMVKDMAEGMSMGNKVSHSWVADHKASCLDVEEALKSFRPQAIVCGIQALGVAFTYEKKYGVPVLPVYLSWDAYLAFQDYACIQPARPSVIAVSSFLETRRQESSPKGLRFTEEFVLHEVPSPDQFEDSGKLAGLRRFLGEGKPPVAVGWGSMIASGMKPVEMLGLALRALRIAGARGVILGGWAQLDSLAEELRCGRLKELGPDADELMEFAATEVYFVNSAPHEWLFPQCCSVVQHGGVGTWQAAIRAGKPAVVTPIFADQFSHAATVERMGLGIGFKKSLQDIEPQELANAIILAEAKAAAAEGVGQKMRAKVGERDAAVLIDDYLRQKEQLLPRQPEQAQRARMGASCTRRLRMG